MTFFVTKKNTSIIAFTKAETKWISNYSMSYTIKFDLKNTLNPLNGYFLYSGKKEMTLSNPLA